MTREPKYFEERSVTVIGVVFWALGFLLAFVIWGPWT